MAKIKDLPRHKRPREKLIEFGQQNLKDKELLAILLRQGSQGKNAIELAEDILRQFSLKKLFYLDLSEFLKIKGIDEAKACAIAASFELSKRALDLGLNTLPIISSSRDASDQLSNIRESKKENFVVLYLNARHQLIIRETVSVGTINASLVHPREVFAPAIKYLSTQIILAHNHPSGDCEPTNNDIEITRRLVEAGEMLGIEVLDHLIISSDNFVSMKEKGMM